MGHTNSISLSSLRTRRLCLALLGAVVGIVAFLCVHTGASLDVTNDAWILDGYVEKDILQHYTGWLFYRDAPLAFPLGISQSMQHPAGTAVTFTDSVPLFAIASRLLAAVLPATFQYFGWFTLGCYAALGAGAALLVSLFLECSPAVQSFAHSTLMGNGTAKDSSDILSHSPLSALAHVLCALLGAALFVTYPILTERAFRHTALAAQAFIVFALYLYFLNRKEGYRPRGTWLVLTVLSATIHPYFVPMVYAVLFADLLAHALHARTKRAWLHSFAFLAANGAATLATLFCIGAFSSPASDGISGYSYFCMNLNSLYNPVSRGSHADMLWSRALPAWEQGLGTYDGFNYLGLGVLAFGATALVWKISLLMRTGAARAQLAARCKQHCALLVVCIALTVFAVSNVLVYNGTVLLSIPIPGFLSRFGNVLRSSGRMFWPVSYLLLLATFVFWARVGAQAAHPLKKRPHSAPPWRVLTAMQPFFAPLFIAALLALQLWDISPALAQKHAAFARPKAEFANPMQSAVWDDAAAYDHIFSLDDTLSQALYPALWAAQNGLTTNDGFTARFDFETHRAQVQTETARLLMGEIRTDTVYLTCDYARFSTIADALLAHRADITAAWVDGIWYAIFPNRPDVALPSPGDGFAVYPDFPLQIAPLTDALWADGVLLSDPRTCIFYAGKTAQDAFSRATQLICGSETYPILSVDSSDPGWVMVTLDMPNAGVLRGKTLQAR